MPADHTSDHLAFGDLLRRQRLAAGLTQEALAARAGLSARGISDLERGVRTHPYRETVDRLANALDLYGAERKTFLALGQEAARHLVPYGARGIGSRALPSRSLASFPIPPNPLIGRGEELATATRLLRDRASRVLTLTGTGGSGKTRLAIETASQLRADFPDGVVFVDLAPLTDPDLVPATIASALGVREQAGRSLLQTLVVSLTQRRMLLVLDNFEHLLVAAVVVSDLLAAAPDLSILATSRARLALTAEHELPVLPLTTSDPRALPPLQALEDVDAVRLFVTRARSLSPAFVLTDGNASAVAGICRRLDGLPLALELAAPWIKVLPPIALLERLDPSLPVLTEGSRDLPARQRTLRDAIAWSHDLLTEEERRLFRRLSIFVGGWTLEAAESVVNVDGSLNILKGMSSLIDKSLLRRFDQMEEAPRFGMLETIREYALDQFRQHEDEERVIRDAHARFFAAMSCAAWPELNAGLREAMRLVRAEEDNLRATLTHLLEVGDAETALRVAGGSLSEYWVAVGGRFGEGRAWLERALHEGMGASPAARAWGLFGLWEITLFEGEQVNARTAAIECHALAQIADDPRLPVLGAFALSEAEAIVGRNDAAIRLAEEAVASARQLGSPGLLGWALMAMGKSLWRTGDLPAASNALEEALHHFRSIGSPWGQADVLTVLAGVARSGGDWASAAQLHVDSLNLRRDFGELVGIYDDLVGLAAIGTAMGQLRTATLLLATETVLRTSAGYAGFAETPMLREQTRQELVEHLGQMQFQRAWDEGSALSTDEAIALTAELTYRLHELDRPIAVSP